MPSGRRALLSIRFLYLSSHDTALGGMCTLGEKQSQQLGLGSVVIVGCEIMDRPLIKGSDGVEGGGTWGGYEVIQLHLLLQGLSFTPSVS